MRPLAPQPNLASEVARRVAGEITAGRFRPGERLPTEAEMMAAMGVSRTVIREAVAALKAEGLVHTRQGSGAFVAADNMRRPFRLEGSGREALADVVAVLELRMAVEVESAALAAQRGSARSVADIRGALEAIERAIGRGGSAIAEDFAFHRAVAAATGNPQFGRFLDFLGQIVIPRQRIATAPATVADRQCYLKRLQDEHRAIYAGIRRRAPDEARAAMRAHLTNSLERYRSFAEEDAAGSRIDPAASPAAAT